MIIILKDIIFFLIVFELVFYFIKYMPFINFYDRKGFRNLFYYGIPMYKFSISSSYSRDEIMKFIKENISPKKIIADDAILLRRKYFKWIQWGTLVFLECKLTIINDKAGSLIQAQFKSIFFPWISVILPFFYSFFYEDYSFSSGILTSILLMLFVYLFGLIEFIALKGKIKKIAYLDSSYNYFS